MSAAKVSVSLFGNSGGLLVSGKRGTLRPYRTYATELRHTEVDGVGFDVAVHSRMRGEVKKVMSAWVYPLAGERPDVVVLQFGGAEGAALVFPPVVINFLIGIARRGGPRRDRFWAMAKKALMWEHRIESRVDEHLPLWWSRSPSRQFEHDLRRFVHQINAQIGSRVILMDIMTMSDDALFVSKRTLERVAVNAAIQRRVADELGAEVFPMGDVLAKWDFAVAFPDGAHLSVPAHRAVGHALAEWIVRGPGPVSPAPVPHG